MSLKKNCLIVMMLLTMGLSTQAMASSSPTFYIEGVVGNVNGNWIQLVSLAGKKHYYPKSFFKPNTEFRPGEVVKTVVRFDRLGELMRKPAGFN